MFPTPWSVNLDSRSTGLSRCVEMHDIVVNAGKELPGCLSILHSDGEFHLRLDGLSLDPDA